MLLTMNAMITMEKKLKLESMELTQKSKPKPDDNENLSETEWA